MMMIKLRGQLFALIAFIAVSFAAHADPKDYPPTAFQLAQICHYVMKTNDGTLDHKEIEVASLGRYTAGSLFDEAEDLIKAHIKSSEDMTEENWSSFIKDTLNYLRQESQEKTIVESFRIEGCESIILKAILAEQEAKARGEVVLWRASNDAPEQARLQKSEDIKASFSHGLFSGFLFDGHRKHRHSLMAARSACTYTFLSAFLYYHQWKKVGDAGLYDKMYADLHDFFEIHEEYPKTYNQNVNIQELFDKVIKWYDGVYQGERWASLRKEFIEIRDLLFRVHEFMQAAAYNYFNVYGIVMTEAEYEHIPSPTIEKTLSSVNNLLASLSSGHEALADTLKIASAALRQIETGVQDNDPTRMLGVFFPPECAVYGRGETFHPKLVFPQEGRLIKLYTYPNVEVVDDNDD